MALSREAPGKVKPQKSLAEELREALSRPLTPEELERARRELEEDDRLQAEEEPEMHLIIGGWWGLPKRQAQPQK